MRSTLPSEHGNSDLSIENIREVSYQVDSNLRRSHPTPCEPLGLPKSIMMTVMKTQCLYQ